MAIDTSPLTSGRDDRLGTTGDDTFTANIDASDLGTPKNTLQTFDTIRARTGNDTLNAEVAVGGLFSSPNIRPTLLGVENINLTVVDEGLFDFGGGGDETDLGLGGLFSSRVTLDLRTSRAAKTVSTVDSDAELRVINARSVSTFGVTRFASETTDIALDVSGTQSKTVTFNVMDTTSDNGPGPTIRYDRGSVDFMKAVANLERSQVTLDGKSTVLEINSNSGSTNEAAVESSVEFLNIGGSRKLTLDGAGSINVGTAFDARKNGGGVVVNDALVGSLVLLLGSGKADTFDSVTSSERLSAKLGDGVDTATIDGSNGLNLDAGTGSDIVRVTGLDAGAADMLMMGTGDDKLDVSLATVDLTSDATPADTFDGGAGDDSLRFTLAGNISAADGQHITGFESLVLADNAANTTSNFTIDLAGLPEVRNITIEGNDNITFNNVTSSVNFFDVATGATNNTLTFNAVGFGNVGFVDLAALNVSVGTDTSGGVAGSSVTDTLAVNGFNAVNLTSKGGFGVATDNDVTVTAAQSETLNISGQGDTVLHSTSNNFTAVNGAAATGDINIVGTVSTNPAVNAAFNGVNFGTDATPVSVTGGSGNDQLVGGESGDTFNLGSGGSDRVYFLNQSQSTAVAGDTDTVSSFDASGNDTLVFNGNGGATPNTAIFATDVTAVRDGAAANTAANELVFLGNVAGTIPVNATLSAFNTPANANDYGAVFDTTSSTLYIDLNHDSMITNVDFAVNVTGKAALAATDLQLAYFTV